MGEPSLFGMLLYEQKASRAAALPATTSVAS